MATPIYSNDPFSAEEERFDPFAAGLAETEFDPFESGAAEPVSSWSRNIVSNAAKGAVEGTGQALSGTWRLLDRLGGELPQRAIIALGHRLGAIDDEQHKLLTDFTDKGLRFNSDAQTLHEAAQFGEQGGKAVQDLADYYTPDPARENEITQQMARAGGQLAPVVISPGTALPVMAGQMGEAQRQAGLAEGDSEDVANAKFDLGAAAAVPLALVSAPVPGAARPLVKAAVRTAGGAGINAAQDVAMQKLVHPGQPLDADSVRFNAIFGGLFGAAHGLTDFQQKNIVKKIEALPPKERTQANVQKIVNEEVPKPKGGETDFDPFANGSAEQITPPEAAPPTDVSPQDAARAELNAKLAAMHAADAQAVGPQSDSGTPSDLSNEARAGGLSMASRTSTPLPLIQPLDVPPQSSANTVPSDSTLRTTTPPAVDGPSRTLIGEVDAGTGRRVIQPTDDVKWLVDAADNALPGFTAEMQGLAEQLPGVQFRGARAKGDTPRLREKLAERPASTNSDFIGARLGVDNPAAADAVVKQLGDRVVKDDDFMDEPRGGYRARHIQVKLENGMTAEVQLIPSEVAEVQSRAHKVYGISRDTQVSPDIRRGAHALGGKIFDEAWTKYAKRNGIPLKIESQPQLTPAQYPIHEFPVDQIEVNKDVPQFKADADPKTGVVEGSKLGGKYERLGTGPIIIWKKLDGSHEVVTGRHRLDLARRSGEKSLPVQVVNEADGWTQRRVVSLDAQSNIRSGQGTVKDFAQYFHADTDLTREQALAKGLIAREKGAAGWALAREGTQRLWDLYANNGIPEGKAVAIARGAPGNEPAQVSAIKQAKTKSAAELELYARNLSRLNAEAGGGGAQLGFGGMAQDFANFEREAEAVSTVQAERMAANRALIEAAAGAAKRPEAARKMGLPVDNAEKLQAKVDQLRAENARLANPDEATYQELRKAAGLPTAEATPAPAAEEPPAPPPPEDPNQEGMGFARRKAAPLSTDQTDIFDSGPLAGGETGGDQTFNLAGESGIDWTGHMDRKAEVTAAKKAQEDAQGSLFRRERKQTAEEAAAAFAGTTPEMRAAIGERLDADRARWRAEADKIAPGMMRSFRLRFGDPRSLVESGKIKAEDLTGYEQAFYDGHEKLLHLFDRALSTNPDHITRLNVLHEMAHAHWDTLTPERQEALAEQWQKETADKTGPLFDGKGKLRSGVAHGVEGDIREWYAERLAWENHRWAEARARGGDATSNSLIGRAAQGLRTLWEQMRGYVQQLRGNTVNTDFRAFLDQGDRFETPGSAADPAAVAGRFTPSPRRPELTDFTPRGAPAASPAWGQYREAIRKWENDMQDWAEQAPNVMPFKMSTGSVKLVSKNIREGEYPWRTTRFHREPDGRMTPIGHQEFPNKVEAYMDAARAGQADPAMVFARRQTESPQFKEWFGESKVTTEDGEPKVVYHGTARADRVGDRFRKNRAASGPMPFFTTDPAVASNYATGKADVSLAHPDDYNGWFKFKGPGMRSETNIDRAWWSLDPAQRQTVLERMKTIGYENADAGEGPIVGNSSSIMGGDSIDYELRQAHGNGLKALTEIWLSSGALFGQEEKFLDVLKAAGADMTKIRYDNPHAMQSGVIPAFLAIKKPLDTRSIPPDVVAALHEAGKRKRGSSAMNSAGLNPDMWDKNTISGKEWLAHLGESLKDPDSAYAFTRIPDWVTETLRAKGYDGIRDRGGKGGGEKHDVWVPFDAEQIKSATGNRGTFDPADPRIAFARRELGSAHESRTVGDRMRDAADHIGSFLRRELTSRGNLPESVFRARVERDGRLNAVKQAMAFSLKDLNKGVRAVYGGWGAVPAAEQARLNDVLGGKAPATSLDPRLQKPIEEMRRQVDLLSRRLVSEGVVSGDLAGKINGNLGFYLNRSYRKFDDPKWASKVKPEVVNRAKTFLRAELRGDVLDKAADAAAAKQGVTDRRNKAWQAHRDHLEQDQSIQPDESHVEGLTEHLLTKDTGGTPELYGAGNADRKDLAVLTRRKELAPEIRDLLGEYHDPRVNYARSVGKTAQILEANRFLTETRAAGMGKFLFNEPRPGYAERLAAEGSKAMAPLDGLYTSPEIAEALQRNLNERQSSNPAWRAFQGLNGWVKLSKTVLSPVTQVRNFTANLGFLVANGHYHAADGGKAVLTALRGEFGGNDAQARAYLTRLARLGIVGESTNAGEFREALRDAGVKMSGIEEWTDGRAAKAAKLPFRAAARLYQMNDEVFKIFAFENELRSWRKALPNEPLAVVEKIAAERVHNTLPTYSRVPLAVQRIRRAAVLGSFTSWPAEVVRTGYHTIRYATEDIRSPNPAIRAMGARRLAGMAAAIGVFPAVAAMSRARYNWDRKDEEDLRRFLPDWVKNSEVMHTSENKDGRASLVDLSYLDPWAYMRKPVLAAMRGENWQEALGGAAVEMSAPFLSEGVLAKVLLDTQRNKDANGRPVYDENADPLTQQQQKLAHVWQAAEPGFVTQARRMVKAAKGEVSATGRAYNPEDELLALTTGARSQSIDVATAHHFQTGKFSSAMNLAQVNYLRARNRPGAEPSAVAEAKATFDKQRAALIEELHQDTAAAQRLGVSQAKIYTNLKAAGLSRLELVSVMTGKMFPYIDRPLPKYEAIRRALQIEPEPAAAY